MTTKTAQECVYQALTEIGRLRSGEAPDNADYQDALARHEPLIAQLSAEGVINIDDPDNVSIEIWLPYCRLLAVIIAPLFGVDAMANLLQRQNVESVNGMEARERRILRNLAATQASKVKPKGQYF